MTQKQKKVRLYRRKSGDKTPEMIIVEVHSGGSIEKTHFSDEKNAYAYVEFIKKSSHL